MNCQDFKNQITDFALGELSAESGRRLEEHAAACSACGAPLRQDLHVHELLKKGWRDEDVPRSLVFTPAMAPASSGFWEWILTAPRWARVSMAAASVVVLLVAVLSLARTELRYDQGHLALSFGRSLPVSTSPAVPGTAAVAYPSLSPQDVEKIITAKYAALSAQDREQYAAMLDQISKQMQAQRETDLMKIGSAFDQLKNIVWKDMQRNNAIVQYAAQRIATDVKN